MGDQTVYASKILSSAIIKAANATKKRIAVIASSDFNHYESADVARSKDLPAIKRLESLDYESFVDHLTRSRDSACGYGPITVATLFALHSGAKHAKLLRYANSGDVTKDYSSVVAYASIVFE